VKWGCAVPLGQATASDFEYAISRFESSRRSQPFLQLATVYNLCLTGPEIWAFRAFNLVSKLPVSQSPGRNGGKSPVLSRKTPVLHRLLAETGPITTAAHHGTLPRLVLPPRLHGIGSLSPGLPPDRGPQLCGPPAVLGMAKATSAPSWSGLANLRGVDSNISGENSSNSTFISSPQPSGFAQHAMRPTVCAT
jgi:hypothetical protein